MSKTDGLTAEITVDWLLRLLATAPEFELDEHTKVVADWWTAGRVYYVQRPNFGETMRLSHAGEWLLLSNDENPYAFNDETAFTDLSDALRLYLHVSRTDSIK